jgi:hypothetical protein
MSGKCQSEGDAAAVASLDQQIKKTHVHGSYRSSSLCFDRSRFEGSALAAQSRKGSALREKTRKGISTNRDDEAPDLDDGTGTQTLKCGPMILIVRGSGHLPSTYFVESGI